MRQAGFRWVAGVAVILGLAACQREAKPPTPVTISGFEAYRFGVSREDLEKKVKLSCPDFAVVNSCYQRFGLAEGLTGLELFFSGQWDSLNAIRATLQNAPSPNGKGHDRYQSLLDSLQIRYGLPEIRDSRGMKLVWEDMEGNSLFLPALPISYRPDVFTLEMVAHNADRYRRIYLGE